MKHVGLTLKIFDQNEKFVNVSENTQSKGLTFQVDRLLFRMGTNMDTDRVST